MGYEVQEDGVLSAQSYKSLRSKRLSGRLPESRRSAGNKHGERKLRGSCEGS